MKSNVSAKMTDWQPNVPANEMGTMPGAAIGWRKISEEKGRGVFALRDLRKGEVLEIAPVVPVSKSSVVENGEAPDGYLLEWDGNYEDEEYCMPLGYVMMYNHNDQPNIMIDPDYEEYTMTVVALRDIKKGEELCWNYSCELWFDEQD